MSRGGRPAPKAFRQSPFCTEISTPVEKRVFETRKRTVGTGANRANLSHRHRPRQRSGGPPKGGWIDRKRKTAVDLHLCPRSGRAIGARSPGPRTTSHETDLPAEQPQAE